MRETMTYYPGTTKMVEQKQGPKASGFDMLCVV